MIINFFRSCEKVSGYVYMIVDVIKLFSEGMHILRPASRNRQPENEVNRNLVAMNPIRFWNLTHGHCVRRQLW